VPHAYSGSPIAIDPIRPFEPPMTDSTLDTYRQLQQQIAADIATRKAEHKRQLSDARRTFAGTSVKPLNLLAVGD
jgi:hypothetical protein